MDAAGKTMDEIVGSVKQVSDIIAEIAAASQEQSAGIEQVNTAIAQMDQVVQQNASLVEEATAADRIDEGAGRPRCCRWCRASSSVPNAAISSLQQAASHRPSTIRKAAPAQIKVKADRAGPN